MATKIAFGFNTPFEEQLAFFRQKLNLPSERWDDIIKSAHDRAFIVAGAMKADLLNDLRGAIDKAVEQGTGLEQFRKDFRQIVAKHGWTGWTGEGTKAGEAWRTRVIYQTNMATSYAAGRWQQLTHPDLLKTRPYWRYVHADGVMNPRPQHQAWNGLVLPYDHPFWKTHFPPNGWGCHCRVVAVDAEEYAKALAAGKGTPPSGWESGTGIDKGFDYAPGANFKRPLQDFIDQKLIKLNPEIAKALAAEVAPVLGSATKAVVEFAELKTAKACAEWAVKNNLADFADYTGIKPEVANAWNKSLFDHLTEFPELRKNQKFVGTCQAQFARWREIEILRLIEQMRAANPQLPDGFDFRPHAEKLVKVKKVDGNTFAQSWSQRDVSGIAVNVRWGKDVAAFEDSLRQTVASKFHPIGCDSIRSVVDHELGHQLDDLLGLSVDNEIVSAYREATELGIKDGVSGYAAKNIKEFIAECWAESLNNPAPRRFAQLIGAIVRARYADKHS